MGQEFIAAADGVSISATVANNGNDCGRCCCCCLCRWHSLAFGDRIFLDVRTLFLPLLMPSPPSTTEESPAPLRLGILSCVLRHFARRF
ncbi:hypothetical protein DERP_012505 [Dermatophagoides pteronyssinus]|uniref:Uncharacterized protein n=1 Tax=Dermatophagoides pteronyssinus TaxID=6956 RepID=A0ABQ8IXT6_DERPT|nr:hypothetical protein DERP_012505 [Dermatophagoides pteronyssinus]